MERNNTFLRFHLFQIINDIKDEQLLLKQTEIDTLKVVLATQQVKYGRIRRGLFLKVRLIQELNRTF